MPTKKVSKPTDETSLDTSSAASYAPAADPRIEELEAQVSNLRSRFDGDHEILMVLWEFYNRNRPPSK